MLGKVFLYARLAFLYQIDTLFCTGQAKIGPLLRRRGDARILPINEKRKNLLGIKDRVMVDNIRSMTYVVKLKRAQGLNERRTMTNHARRREQVKPGRPADEVMSMLRSRCTRARAMAIIIVECSMMVAFAIHIPITPFKSLQASFPRKAIPSQLRTATMPNSSDPSGDEWPMFRRTLNHTGATSTTPSRAWNPFWTYTTNDCIDSSPAVVGNRVYFGCWDKNIYCLDATTGTKIWNYTTGRFIYKSSPAIADGRLYVGSSDKKVYCLNATTGKHIWNFSSPSYDGWFTSSPAIMDGRLYIGSDEGAVYCLDAKNGTKLWNYTIYDLYAINLNVRSSPALAYGRVYVGGYNSMVYCLNATTGTCLWSHDRMSFEFESSPAVANYRVYIGCTSGELFCFSLFSDYQCWSYYPPSNQIYSSPSVSGDRCFFASCGASNQDPNFVTCLNATTGAKIWSHAVKRPITSSPALASDKLYIGGTYDNKIYCLNSNTGQLIWSFATEDMIWSSPAIANGRVYVGSFDHKLYCLPMEFIAPAIVHPAAKLCYVNTTGNTLSWGIVTQSTGVTNYTITRDGSLIANQIWTPGTNITINIDGLSLGRYEYAINVTDAHGCTSSDMVIVLVTQAPPDFQPVIYALVAIAIAVPAGIVSMVVFKKRRKIQRGRAT